MATNCPVDLGRCTDPKCWDGCAYIIDNPWPPPRLARCDRCDGTGSYYGNTGIKVTCPDCLGTGRTGK